MDRRGAVAFEMPIVFLVLMLSLFVPLFELSIAGYQFLSAYQALRGFGEYIQYHVPPDVTNTSAWQSSLVTTTVEGYQIRNIEVICGTTACSSSNSTAVPKYYTYQTTVTLNPKPTALLPVLCSGNPSCTFTLYYSERFQ